MAGSKSTVHNVILFGESGAGKSSLVNMITGEETAKVSDSAGGCTFKSEPHKALINNTFFVVHDTAGLNEGDHGRVPNWEAIRALYMLIRQLDGVSLLIYCMRGRVKDNAYANWILFNKVICGENVPIIAVVTGLEGYNDPDAWWEDSSEGNQGVFKRNGINPKGVGCVVSYQGRQREHKGLYDLSQVKLRNLITAHCLQQPWRKEKERWFANIYSESFSTMPCFGSRSVLDYTEEMRGIIDELIGKETDMKAGDVEKLRTTLLEVEKKFRKSQRRNFFRFFPSM